MHHVRNYVGSPRATGGRREGLIPFFCLSECAIAALIFPRVHWSHVGDISPIAKFFTYFGNQETGTPALWDENVATGNSIRRLLPNESLSMSTSSSGRWLSYYDPSPPGTGFP